MSGPMTEHREALAALERIKTSAIENSGRLTPGAILDIQVAINAIEAEARSEGPGLDAERLAWALHGEFWDDSIPREEGEACCRPSAERILAALAAQENPEASR